MKELPIIRMVKCPITGNLIEVSTCNNCKAVGTYIYDHLQPVGIICHFRRLG